LAAIDEPVMDPVTAAGSPSAAARSRWTYAANDQCSTATAPER
jgi:hypothetical protein